MITDSVDGQFISIDSADLASKGNSGALRALLAKDALSEMENMIASLPDAWEGQAAESYYVDLVKLLRDIQPGFEELAAYPGTLREVAATTDIVAAETKAIAEEALEEAQRIASMMSDEPTWASV